MATKSKLTALQRAAVIIISLGAQRASDIYKFLKEEEVEQLSLEIAKMDRLSEEEMQETIEDFYGLCVTQKVINEGGTFMLAMSLRRRLGRSRPLRSWHAFLSP